MKQPPVPVIFSSSNYFLPYAAAAIQSLIAHADKSREYHIYLFHNSITEYNARKILRMQTENVRIVLRDFSEIAEDKLYVPGTYISHETYYRLFAVELLRDYEKLVYLDCDVIMLRDIADLYDTDIDGYILGAVRNYNDFGSLRHIRECLGIPPERCFNAGVMLINTSHFINSHVKERCLNLLETIKTPLWVDQELLNISCWQETKLLDEKWNVQYGSIANERGEKPPALKAILERVRNDPYILHYNAGDVRPWTKPDEELAEYFWKYARQTEFYEEIIYRNAGRYRDENQAFFKYLFPFDGVKKGSRVVLYGMGKVGSAFYAQNQLTNYCRILFCADRNYREFTDSPVTVLAPETLKNDIFDFVVIAIENENIRKQIQEYVEKLGVPPEKIVAENPLKL